MSEDAVSEDAVRALSAATPGRPRRRIPPLALAGALILGLVVILALFAPLLSPYEPRDLSGESLEPPSAEHLLGTDSIGHDVMSQLIWGARVSVGVATVTSLLAVGAAILVGVGSGLSGGAVDNVAMRIVDVFLALPGIPLVITIAALAGHSLVVVTLVIAFALWPPRARILRGQTLSLKSKGFVLAARGAGASRWYVIRHHLTPALGPLLATGFITAASLAVGLEAGLALLGVGDPLSNSWGTMLNRAINFQGIHSTTAWVWWVLPAGLAVTITVLGFTCIGVGLETVWNRRLIS